jgi:hypothetical protein
VVGCKTNPQRQLRNKGIRFVRDVVRAGELIGWDEGPSSYLPRPCRRAYEKVISNSTSTPVVEESDAKISVYMQGEDTDNVWEFYSIQDLATYQSSCKFIFAPAIEKSSHLQLLSCLVDCG